MTPIHTYNFSARTLRVLYESGIETLDQLAALTPSQIHSMHYCGDGTKREMISACVKTINYMPEWVEFVGLRYKDMPLLIDDEPPVNNAGMTLLAGPFTAHETLMLEAAIASLGDMRWFVCQTPAGKWLYRDSVGYVDVGEE